MEDGRRTWLILTGRGRLRILQVTHADGGIDAIVHGTGGPRQTSPGGLERCAAHIVNRAVDLQLVETLVLAGPPDSLSWLEAGLDGAALARIVAIIPNDVVNLSEIDLLRRFDTVLARTS